MFFLRFKILIGVVKPVRTEKIHGGIADFYNYKDKEERVIRVQSDGVVLSLLRLNALRHFSLLKPFVKFCKFIYIKKYGKQFQSYLFSNYFEEYEHPVRVGFRELDALGKTIIDC